MGVRKGTKPFVFGKREEEILKAVYLYRYMTSVDVCFLLYSPASLAHVRRLLLRLAGGGDYVENWYLYRFALQEAMAGNRIRVYTLGSKGRDYFKTELEYEVAWYFRPGKARHLSLGQTMHNLCLTRFLVAAKIWAGERTDCRLMKVRTCYEFGTDFPSVEAVQAGKREYARVIPDGWLLFEVREAGEWFTHSVLIEIDRGTAYRNKFKEQIASRLEFIKEGGVYSRLFGRQEVMIAYVTTGETSGFREARRRAMCVWTAEVLREKRRESWAAVFRFASVAFDEIYEAGLFERQVWYMPGKEKPVGLFEG